LFYIWGYTKIRFFLVTKYIFFRFFPLVLRTGFEHNLSIIIDIIDFILLLLLYSIKIQWICMLSFLPVSFPDYRVLYNSIFAMWYLPRGDCADCAEVLPGDVIRA